MTIDHPRLMAILVIRPRWVRRHSRAAARADQFVRSAMAIDWRVQFAAGLLG